MKTQNKYLLIYLVAMVFLLILSSCEKQENLFEYKVKKWTSNIPCCFSTSYQYSEINNPNDYLSNLYNKYGIDIFYVGGLNYYHHTNQNSIKYDYIIIEDKINNIVSDTLWFPNINE